MNLPITITIPWGSTQRYKSKSPYEEVKPWLIKNVGNQHSEWDWMLFPRTIRAGMYNGNIQNLTVSFKTEKAAMLFVMTFT